MPTTPADSDSELQARVASVLAPAYDVEREVGRGGMGIVYRAKDVRLKRVVAVKLLPPELAYRTEIRTRFLQEAETAAQLSHPNIVPIYTVDEREGLVYFVMAFIDGDNLGARLRATGPLPADEARRIMREVAQALAFAHSRGVIHRDIKPDNILLAAEDGRAMVTDFGIARAVDDGGGTRLTATGVAIGTPAYMSPEQCAGDRAIDGRSDLYALGVVGYQMLSGVPPFTGSSTPALLVKQISEMPVPLRDRSPGVPEGLANAVMTLLAKAPNDRFADAAALVAALDNPTNASLFPPPPRPSTSFAAPAPAPAPAPAVVSTFTNEEIVRWGAPPVMKFRKRFRFYAVVNTVLIVVGLFGSSDMFGLTGMWSVLMAYWYAKLWTDGYDWHDVFKQPRDRMFFDVAAEAIEDARGMFDRDKRAAMRERERERLRIARETGGVTPPGYAVVGGGRTGSRSATKEAIRQAVDQHVAAAITAATGGDRARVEESRRAAREERRTERRRTEEQRVPDRRDDRAREDRSREERAAQRQREAAGAAVASAQSDVITKDALALVSAEVLAGPHGPLVKRAVTDRAAVRDIVEKLGPADRALLPDVVQTVANLVERIASLAAALHRLDAEVVPDALPATDRRIAAAEAEPESPDRERKLALLRKQRTTLRDLVERRGALYAQMENAGLVLQNIRFDLLKLRSSGVQSAIDDVTSATQEARALSREIGNVLNVAQELKAI